MIRKAIIVVLTLMAMTTVVLWAVSFAFPHGQLDPPGIGLQSKTADRNTAWMINPRELTLLHTVRWTGEKAPEEWHYLYFGFSTQGFMIRGGFFVRGVGFPIWFPVAVFAAYPIIAFIRGPLRRRRRRRKGLCVPCGYNLTGNESGVCPECGREP